MGSRYRNTTNRVLFTKLPYSTFVVLKFLRNGVCVISYAYTVLISDS